jgi:hypothetical protein
VQTSNNKCSKTAVVGKGLTYQKLRKTDKKNLLFAFKPTKMINKLEVALIYACK